MNTCPSLPRIYVVAKRSLTTFPIQRNASEALVELSLSIGVEEIVAAGKKANFFCLSLLIKFEYIYT